MRLLLLLSALGGSAHAAARDIEFAPLVDGVRARLRGLAVEEIRDTAEEMHWIEGSSPADCR